jgi:hypothetical protein
MRHGQTEKSMKDAALWTLDDLNQLIKEQAEESLSLEFKHGQILEDLENRQAADRRKEEISKDVSAFANRLGGVIVYGLEEAKHEPHQAKALTPIDPAKCSKERLEQIITSRIRPPIEGLVINPIELSPGGVVYAVKIPRSHTAHQASDKRYYRRVNFGNAMMEDDEIRQAMNRQIKPTYHVQLETSLIEKAQLVITGNVQNTSPMISHDVSVVLLLPNEMSRYGTAWGTESIQNQIYVKVLNDHRSRISSTLKPFDKMGIAFETAAKIPDEPPAHRVPLFVHVYDQWGQAHVAEFIISLHPAGPSGVIVDNRQQSRGEGI